MKKLLKKICMFGVSAATALSFCTPAVEGRNPVAGDRGVLFGSTVAIAKNDTAPVADFNLNTLTFNGTAQQLISSVKSVTIGTGANAPALAYTGNDAKVKLYLRVAEADDEMPTADTDWIEYKITNGKNNLDDAALKKTDAGTYYVFYYINGGDNVRDSGAGADGTGTGA